MLTTDLSFHQVAILGKQGLGPLEAVMKFLPQTLTGILATMLTGRLFDRVNPNAFCRLFENHAGGCAAHVAAQSSGWAAILYGLVLGAAGGSLRGMEMTAHVRDFGTIHSGRARGRRRSVSRQQPSARSRLRSGSTSPPGLPDPFEFSRRSRMRWMLLLCSSARPPKVSNRRRSSCSSTTTGRGAGRGTRRPCPAARKAFHAAPQPR